MTQEKSYGTTILRLLIDGTLEPVDGGSLLWGELLHVAAQNCVLIRVVDRLQEIGLEPRHFFYAAVKEMRTRNLRKLSLMARIGARCVDNNIDFIFPKAIQNYPDLSGDIDLYLASYSVRDDERILHGLKAAPNRRTLRNRIDGTATYRVAGIEATLDIHHGRVGMLGEHKLYVKQIIENGRYVTADGEEFLVPSPEDQLILQSLQRIVQRSYFRLSDLVTTITLLRSESINWNYLLSTVKSLNIFYGLSCYLNFVEHIHRDAFNRELLPRSLAKSLVSNKPVPVEFRNGFYHFPRIAVGSRGYANKFCSAVLSENWGVASRLSLLPVLALSTIVRKVRTSH